MERAEGVQRVHRQGYGVEALPVDHPHLDAVAHLVAVLDRRGAPGDEPRDRDSIGRKGGACNPASLHLGSERLCIDPRRPDPLKGALRAAALRDVGGLEADMCRDR